MLINNFLSSNPIKCLILQSAFSCLALLLHNFDIFFSKFSLLLTSWPSKVTFSEFFIYRKLILKLIQQTWTPEIVFSSAKLWRSKFLIYIKRSFMNKLKRIGLRIEPCRTPDKINWKVLYMLLIWTLCFCRFR